MDKNEIFVSDLKEYLSKNKNKDCAFGEMLGEVINTFLQRSMESTIEDRSKIVEEVELAVNFYNGREWECYNESVYDDEPIEPDF